MPENPTNEETGDIPSVHPRPGALLEEVSTLHDPRREAEKTGSQRMDHGKMSRSVPREDRRAITLQHAIATRRKKTTNEALPRGATLEGEMLGEKRLKTAVNHGDFKVPSQ